jgi:branched-chain amino acid transport system substrate-binding protein
MRSSIRNTRFLLAAWLAAASMAFGGASFAQSGAKVVKIGAVLPLSGVFADSGKDVKRVYDMYQKEVNASGGIKSLGGAKVEFVYMDAQSKPEVSRAATERLALQKDVSALIGPVYSPLALTMAEVAEKYGIPMVIDAAIENSLTEKGYKYVFRADARSKDFAEATSRYIVEKLKPKNVAFVFADAIAYQSVMTTVKEKLKAANIPVLFEEAYAVNTTNFGPIVQKLARFQPEVVIGGGYDADAILLAKTIAEQNVKLKAFVGQGGGFSTLTFLKAAGKAAEGIAASAAWGVDDKASPESPKFIKSFKAEYGEVPNQMNSAASTAALLLFAAIEKAGSTDRNKIRDALTKVEVWTPQGKISFDEKGQGQKDARIIQVQNGEFVTVWPDALATKKLIYPISK